MKKLVFVLAAGAVGLMLKTTAVHAQGTAPDHLLCYKVQDTFKLPVPNSVDMLADLQPEFTQRGCTLIKPDEFCVPATKVAQPAPPNNVPGQPLQDDYICYTMLCKHPIRPSAKVVTDQFAQRRQAFVKPERICVPASKAPLGCPVGGTTAASCGGACPAGEVCHFGPATKGAKPTCQCVTPPNGCAKPDKFGACGGDCASQPGTTCQPSVTATGTHICACLPPPPPGCGIDPTTGICGGTCPTDPTAKCGLDSTGQCTCVRPSTCDGPAGPNGCGGTCSLPGQVCHPDATGICTCATPCGQNPLTGQCGGDCPAGSGQTCQLTPTGCNCVGPTNVPCSVDANGVCGGTCPPGSPAGATCGLDTTGACNCQPAPVGCGPGSVPNTCNNGVCPAPATCQLIPGAAGPVCGCK